MRQRNIIKRTPAQQAYLAAVRGNNHGEATFLTRWLQYARGIPFPFARNFKVRDNRNMTFDFACPDTRVAVEIDGDVHAIIRQGEAIWMNWKKMEQDREKWNIANEDGWTLLNFTARQVEDEPEKVIGQVLRVLEKRSEGR